MFYGNKNIRDLKNHFEPFFLSSFLNNVWSNFWLFHSPSEDVIKTTDNVIPNLFFFLKQILLLSFIFSLNSYLPTIGFQIL